MHKNYLLITLFFVTLHAETDESKAMIAYVQSHIKTAATPLPEKLKNKAQDLTVLEDFVKNPQLSLDALPQGIIEKCKDLVFRDALLGLLPLLKTTIVSDDKIIQAIIKKLSDKEVYQYFSAKIDRILANNDAFNATIKSASQAVKDSVLLDLLLTTASQFGTTQEYQKTNDFKKNESFIKLTLDAGAKMSNILTTLQGLGLSASEQQSFITALLAPHFDYIDFLLKNGLDKNLMLPGATPEKKVTLLDFYETQLKTITEKVGQIVSTELQKSQDECKKIIALLKPAATPPAAKK